MSEAKTEPMQPPEKIDYQRVGYRRTYWIFLTSFAPVVVIMWFLVTSANQNRAVYERSSLDLAAGGLTRITFISPRDERLAVRVTQRNALDSPRMPQAFSVLSCQITADGKPVPLSSMAVSDPAPPVSGRLDLAEFDVRKGQSCVVEVTTLQPLFSYASHRPQLRILSLGVGDEPFPLFRFMMTPLSIVFTFWGILIFRSRMLAAQRQQVLSIEC